MWKMSFLTVALASLFLVGCNNNDAGNNLNDETPMQDVENSVDRDNRYNEGNIQNGMNYPNGDSNVQDNVDGYPKTKGNDTYTAPNVNGTGGVDGGTDGNFQTDENNGTTGTDNSLRNDTKGNNTMPDGH